MTGRLIRATRTLLVLAGAATFTSCSGDRPSALEPGGQLGSALTNISITNPPLISVAPNTFHSTVFNVTNSGVGAGPVRLVCSASGAVHCTSTAPRDFTIGVNQTLEVGVSWSVGARTEILPKAGILMLTDQLSGKKGSQTVNWQ